MFPTTAPRSGRDYAQRISLAARGSLSDTHAAHQNGRLACFPFSPQRYILGASTWRSHADGRRVQMATPTPPIDREGCPPVCANSALHLLTGPPMSNAVIAPRIEASGTHPRRPGRTASPARPFITAAMGPLMPHTMIPPVMKVPTRDSEMEPSVLSAMGSLIRFNRFTNCHRRDQAGHHAALKSLRPSLPGTLRLPGARPGLSAMEVM